MKDMFNLMALAKQTVLDFTVELGLLFMNPSFRVKLLKKGMQGRALRNRIYVVNLSVFYIKG